MSDPKVSERARRVARILLGDELWNEAEAERIRLEVTCDALMQLLKAAEAERDAARARLARVSIYLEQRDLVGVTAEGFAGAVLALLDAPLEPKP